MDLDPGTLALVSEEALEPEILDPAPDLGFPSPSLERRYPPKYGKTPARNPFLQLNTDYMHPLLSCQQEGLNNFLDWDRDPEGARERSILMATGLGKTYLAALCMRNVIAKGGRVVWVTDSIELVEQTKLELEAVLGISVDVEQGDKHSSRTSPILITTAATCAAKGGRRLKELVDSGFDPTYIVMDEAHHSESDTHKAFDEAFPLSRVLNLTATPFHRAQNKRMALGEPLVEVSIEEAIFRDWLVPFEPAVHNILIDGLRVAIAASKKKGKKDYQSPLTVLMTSESVLQVSAEAIVREMNSHREIDGPMKGIVYCCNNTHGYAMADRLMQEDIRINGAGGKLKIATVFEDTPPDVRKDTIAKYRAGEIDLLVNNMCLTEGFNDLKTNFIACLRPTDNASLWIQIIGRGLRKILGKKKCVVLDVVDRKKVVGSAVEDALPDVAEMAQRAGELGRAFASQAVTYLHWFRRKKDLADSGVREGGPVPSIHPGHKLVSNMTGAELLSELIPSSIDATGKPLTADFHTRAGMIDFLQAGQVRDDDPKGFSVLFDALNISQRKGFGGQGTLRKFFAEAGWAFCPHLIAPKYLRHEQTTVPDLNEPVNAEVILETNPVFANALTEIYGKKLTLAAQVDRFVEILPYDPAKPHEQLVTWYKPLPTAPASVPDDFLFVSQGGSYFVRAKSGKVYWMVFTPDKPPYQVPYSFGKTTHEYQSIPPYAKRPDLLVQSVVGATQHPNNQLMRTAKILKMDPNTLQAAGMSKAASSMLISHDLSEEHRKRPANKGKSDLEIIKEFLMAQGELPTSPTLSSK